MEKLSGLSTVLEEELTSKENLTRQCQRAEAEVIIKMIIIVLMMIMILIIKMIIIVLIIIIMMMIMTQANNWRLKFEKEGVAKIEELESTKMKLQVKMVAIMVIKTTILIIMMLVIMFTQRPDWRSVKLLWKA